MRITQNALNALATITYIGIGRAWLFNHLQDGETTNQLAAKKPTWQTIP